MGEILFLCGDNKRAAVATLSVIRQKVEGSEDGLKEEVTQNLSDLVIDFSLHSFCISYLLSGKLFCHRSLEKHLKVCQLNQVMICRQF